MTTVIQTDPANLRSLARASDGWQGATLDRMALVAEDNQRVLNEVRTLESGTAQFITKSCQFFVSPDGSEDADGLSEVTPISKNTLVAFLRKSIIPAGVGITVQFAAGDYTGRDPFSNPAPQTDPQNRGYLMDFAGLQILHGGSLTLRGDPTTPGNVNLFGDTDGNMVKARDAAFVFGCEGAGLINVTGFNAQYFFNGLSTVPAGTTFGNIEIRDFTISDCDGGVQLNRSTVQVATISNGTITDASLTGIFCQGVSGIVQVGPNISIDGSGAFFGAAVIMDTVQKVQFSAGDSADLDVSNNPAAGIDCIGCGSVLFSAFSFSTTAVIRIEDNGGDGVLIRGCGDSFWRDLDFGSGTAKSVVNRNTGSGVLVRGGLLRMEGVTNADNVVAAPQTFGIRAEFGGTIEKVGGTVSIKGTSAAESTVGNGHIG